MGNYLLHGVLDEVLLQDVATVTREESTTTGVHPTQHSKSMTCLRALGGDYYGVTSVRLFC